MTYEEKLSVIKSSVSLRDGKQVIPCAKAFLLSQEYDIPVKEIGDICENESVKIISCQLGCFE